MSSCCQICEPNWVCQPQAGCRHLAGPYGWVCKREGKLGMIEPKAAALFIATLMFSLGVRPALADLKLCNNTQNRVGVALGYKDAKGWASEGWWNIGPNACETLLKGALIARYYYIYAVDYDKGGAWGGKAIMCTRDKIFTI